MEKDLSYYLKLNYQILLKQDEDNGEVYYETEIPDLPGCGTHGKTQSEALKRLKEVKELWLEARLKRGLSIPEPSSEDQFSGRLLLRMPAKLHMELSSGAKKEGISLNQFIRRTLENNLTFETIHIELNDLSSEVKILKEEIAKLCKLSIYANTAQSFAYIGVSPLEGQTTSIRLLAGSEDAIGTWGTEDHTTGIHL
jgi:predicted RNase H-like HicB family nuclease